MPLVKKQISSDTAAEPCFTGTGIDYIVGGEINQINKLTINKIRIVNLSESEVKVDAYVTAKNRSTNNTNTYYIFKSYTIAAGNFFTLNDPYESTTEYNFYIDISSGSSGLLDVVVDYNVSVAPTFVEEYISLNNY
tara:strand:+ start:67 stop:474 length:408 start_codon:yes stop_codon:yes gene_type:complete